VPPKLRTAFEFDGASIADRVPRFNQVATDDAHSSLDTR
jgi:hypothetical protein